MCECMYNIYFIYNIIYVFNILKLLEATTIDSEDWAWEETNTKLTKKYELNRWNKICSMHICYFAEHQVMLPWAVQDKDVFNVLWRIFSES